MIPKATYTDVQLAEMLTKAGIRLSAQRIAVFAIVANGSTHPTADEIFSELSERYPSLSRTTIYNSLHTLVDAGLIRQLEIESSNMRYDLVPQQLHSHFMCCKCGRIYDLPMPPDIENFVANGFTTQSIDLCFKGLCPNCSNNH